MFRNAVILLVLLVAGCTEPGAMTSEEAAHVALMDEMSRAFNAKDPDLLERFYSEDVVYRSHGPWAPQGRTLDREGLKKSLAFGMRAFPDRRTTLKNRYVDGDTVVEEVEWVGTASMEHPTLPEGERQILQDVTFTRFRDGKIVEVREYA